MTVATHTRHSDTLATAGLPVWRSILEHPFLRELRDSTLPMETFRFYVQQDWL